jgi:hypothetical protein
MGDILRALNAEMVGEGCTKLLNLPPATLEE